MSDLVTAVCPFCNRESEAIQRDAGALAEGYPPGNPLEEIPTARMLHGGGCALLHHPCPDLDDDPEWPRDERYWEPSSAWWACKRPERSLDEHAHFDLYCSKCAKRWAGERSGG